MGEVSQLFAVLAAIYLAECLLWARRGSVVFVTTWLDWARPAQVGKLFGRTRAGAVLANPIPLFAPAFRCEAWPLSMSEEGLLAYSAHSYDPAGRVSRDVRWLDWEQVREATASLRDVQVNGERFVTTGSEQLARQLAALIGDLAALPAAERQQAIDGALDQALCPAAVRMRLDAWRGESHIAALLAQILFLFLYVLAPMAVLASSFAAAWPWLLAGLVGLVVMQAIAFYQAHRRLNPRQGLGRLQEILELLLCPPAGCRAHDKLARPLLATFHPLAVGRVLCTPEVFRELARATLRDLQHAAPPHCPSDDPGAGRTEASFRGRLRERALQLVREAGLEPRELLAPPPPEPGCQSFCPRCHCQYSLPEGLCEDCLGVPLVRLG